MRTVPKRPNRLSLRRTSNGSRPAAAIPIGAKTRRVVGQTPWRILTLFPRKFGDAGHAPLWKLDPELKRCDGAHREVMKITALRSDRRDHFGVREFTSGMGGSQMNRQPSACDFCGAPEPMIPYDEPAFCWYACPECTQLIENGEWERLTERCITGHEVAGSASGENTRLLRDQTEALVRVFRECFLLPTR